jgi:hypothetical protein
MPILDDTLSVLVDKHVSSFEWEIACRLAVREALGRVAKEHLPQKEMVYLTKLCMQLAPVHVQSWYEEETSFGRKEEVGQKRIVLSIIEKLFATRSMSPHR